MFCFGRKGVTDAGVVPFLGVVSLVIISLTATIRHNWCSSTSIPCIASSSACQLPTDAVHVLLQAGV